MAYRHRVDVLPPPRPSFSITRRPKSKLAVFFWKRRIWLESTFALTGYEPWEKVVVGQLLFYFIFFDSLCTYDLASNVVTMFVIISYAMLVGLFSYLPRRLMVMQRWAVYYLWGGDESNMGPATY